MMTRALVTPPPPPLGALRCCSSSKRLLTVVSSSSSSRNQSNIPKLKPFSRNLLDRALQQPPLIQKAINEIADYCTTLEGDECYGCWRAYFDLKDLEQVAPKADLERTIVESNGLNPLIRSIHRLVSIYNIKKKDDTGKEAAPADGRHQGKREHDHVPDGLPKTPEELEEEEKAKMADSAHTRLLRKMGKFPAWYTPAPDHETD